MPANDAVREETAIEKKRLLKIAEQLDYAVAHPQSCEYMGDDDVECDAYEPIFSMDRYFHPCGAASCIAGHALSMAASEDDLGDFALDANEKQEERARKYLGLAQEQADALFLPKNAEANMDARPGQNGYISPQRAAAVLRRLAETGEVNWSVRE